MAQLKFDMLFWIQHCILQKNLGWFWFWWHHMYPFIMHIGTKLKGWCFTQNCAKTSSAPYFLHRSTTDPFILILCFNIRCILSAFLFFFLSRKYHQDQVNLHFPQICSLFKPSLKSLWSWLPSFWTNERLTNQT